MPTLDPASIAIGVILGVVGILILAVVSILMAQPVTPMRWRR